MNIYLDSQIVVQTAAEWAADTEVYSQLRILVTSDVYYTGTDQRKFKLANGVDAWSDLDYMPLGGSSTWGGITGTLSSQTDLQNALDAKEPTITAGTTSQYYRGDKSFQTLDKNAVGLGNVDNTSDANKPVSTATQTALNAKQDSLGYTAENSANKTDVMSGNTTSSTKFLSAKGVYDWVTSLGFITNVITALGYTPANKAGETFTGSITATNLSGTNTGDETAARIGAIVNTATDYTTPLDADKIGIWDVANSLFKALTWANLKATLKAYFDDIYLRSFYFAHTSYNPADATTYYFNSNIITGSPATANTNRWFKFTRSQTLKELNLITIQGNVASGESANLYIYNVTTGADVGLVGPFTNNAGASTIASFNYTGLSLAVNSTDKYAWKIVTPTYATNPTGVVTEIRPLFS